jgi:methylamine---glutamate N-methyltransferase subunit A
MCGIAGILYKTDGERHDIGQALIDMLDGCQHRGPDSTGFALYHESNGQHQMRLRFIVGENGDSSESVARIERKLAALGAAVIEEELVGSTARFTIRFRGDVQQLSYELEQVGTLVSLGESLDIVKDVGGAHDVDDIYHVAGFAGTHGIGHVRLATESDVTPDRSHPFWATGFADVAIVHNGQITNYWKMRRRLEKRGMEFHTDNDSELIAVYLADKLEQGVPLAEALESSIRDMDGTFSFLVSTKEEIGYAKDNLAAKPMVMYEDDHLVAIASEEVSLNKLFPGRALVTAEPAPGTYRTWRRST